MLENCWMLVLKTYVVLSFYKSGKLSFNCKQKVYFLLFIFGMVFNACTAKIVLV